MVDKHVIKNDTISHTEKELNYSYLRDGVSNLSHFQVYFENQTII